MMADNQLLNDNDDGVGGGDDIFVYTGGEQEVPRDMKRIKIAENVDIIAEGVFEYCQELIEVEGHNRLKKIEKWAFNNCPSLGRVTKMRDVVEIEEGAFCECWSLSELEFDKLEIIGEAAFIDCESLTSINMPSVRRVGPSAFANCKKLTGAVFGQKLESIDINTFFDCTALKSIDIPLKDLIIHIHAFNRCENLSRVDVLDGGIDNTISSLHLESWRDVMLEEIDYINQILPTYHYYNKAGTIIEWINIVLSRMEHYKTEHKVLVKEAMTLLELALWKAKLINETDDAADAQEGVRVTRGQRKRKRKDKCITSGASIVIKNVLPFLALK
jgi:hypothetical protein